MNLNKTHRQHEKEVTQMKDFDRRMLVGRKYFKSFSPNFLTFAEKEQIRKLHEDDPQKYTIDELSHSFPADPKTISILLRNRWTPKDTTRVQKHDESVKKNWEAFKEGKLEIDPMLAQHLQKFSLRDFNRLAQPEPYRRLGVQVPKPKGNEFLSIITSCKKYAEVDEKEAVNEPVTSGRPLRVRKIESNETRLPELKHDKDDDMTLRMKGPKEFSNKNITLEQLQKQKPGHYTLPKSEEKELELEKFTQKFKTLEVHQMKGGLSDFKAEVEEKKDIKPFIRIPKAAWKRGKLYKVRDCFYSDDGEFLYRVPGLD
jgi:hypothetical protein